MDRIDMEPCYGLHEDQPRVQALLCRAHGEAAPGDGPGELRQRVQGLRCTEHAVELPLTWKRPRNIFVNSMSDLFHDAVPVEFTLRVFDVMRRANWHQYQLLTKRSERLLELD